MKTQYSNKLGGYENKLEPELVEKVRTLIVQAKQCGTIPTSVDGGALLSSKHRTPEECHFLEALSKSAARISIETCEQAPHGPWAKTARALRQLSTGAVRGTK